MARDPKELRAQLARFNAWARHGQLYPGADPKPSRGYDATWDRLELEYAHRRGTALWWEEGLAILNDQRRERAAAEHEARERARIEAALRAHAGERGSVGDPLSRASAYLARAEGAVSGDGRNPKAWSVVNRVVRGFALEERAALVLLETEYAPRCKPRLPRSELLGMVRRALRASHPPWGYLLTDRQGARS